MLGCTTREKWQCEKCTLEKIHCGLSV